MHPSRDDIAAYVHFADSMEPSAKAEVERHLAECARCAKVSDESRGEGNVIRGALSRPGPEVTLPAKGTWWRWVAAAVALLAILPFLRPATTTAPPRLHVNLPPPFEGRVVGLHGDPIVAQGRTIHLGRGWRGEMYVESEQSFSILTDAVVMKSNGARCYVEVDVREAKSVVMVLVLAGMVQLTNSYGSESGSRGESLVAMQDSAPKKSVEDLALRFAKHYVAIPVTAKPSIPPYALPLDLSSVANFEYVRRVLSLAKDEPLLVKNGFVVVPLGKEDDMVKPYEMLKEQEIPIFVTSDTLLHLYHVQFDETLKDIEEREFHGDIAGIAEMLATKLAAEYATAQGVLKESAYKALAAASIGLKALRPDAAIDAAVRDEVDRILAKMTKHEGYWPIPERAEVEWPLFRYAEDFSQYVPRGHYTRSELLKRYFVGMMWFGRMTFLLKGGEPHGIGDEPNLATAAEAKLQTIAAASITRLLATAKLADGRTAREVWERVYGVTAFYVGLADDLGMAEYADALTKVAGAAMDVAKLADDGTFAKFQEELAKHPAPAIYGGTGGLATDERTPNPAKLKDALDKTTGFRLMGQRFVPDSYMMGKLVFPTVGRPNNGRTDMFTCTQGGNGPIRGIPRGLDVMALLGSARARELLRELGDDAYGTNDQGKDLKYDAAFEALKMEFAGFSEKDWNRNLYWSWLWSLQPLLANYGEGYPSFMTTEAWRDKSLSTALASWAQLRHDTILYVKQSYTLSDRGGPPPKPKKVGGYVEPVPAFYARLLALTRMTQKGLGEMKVLTPPAVERLEKLEAILAQLLAISEKELANEALTPEELDYIRNFAKALEGVRVKYPDLEAALKKAQAERDVNKVRELREALDADRSMKTTIIADVHTDTNSNQVLEEGTGYVRLAVVCYRQADGTLVIGAGPVLSYHEFKHPMADRLTDEKWTEMLKKGQGRDVEWAKSHVKVAK